MSLPLEGMLAVILHHAAGGSIRAENPTVHTRINARIADLHVVCTGVSDGTIFFAKDEHAIPDNEALANEIMVRLKEFRADLEGVTTLALSE